MAEKNWLQQEWQDTKDFANVGASTIAKLIQWGGIGGLQMGKKFSPFAPLDKWNWSQMNPKNWTEEDYDRYGHNAFKIIEDVADPERQHGWSDFYGTWKPNVGHALGELSQWVAPVTQSFGGDPEKIAEAISTDIYPFGSTGDTLGLAHIGNFKKNEDYADLQQSLVEGIGPENYEKMVKNPLYRNVTNEKYQELLSLVGSYYPQGGEELVSSMATEPFITEKEFDAWNSRGLVEDFNMDEKGEGFFIDGELFTTPIEGQGGMTTPYRIFVDNFNDYTKNMSVQDLNEKGILDNNYLHTTLLRKIAQGWNIPGTMNSVVMMPEDKATNFTHDNIGMTMSLLGDDWNAGNPMEMIGKPTFSDELPIVGDKNLGLGKWFNDIMMEEYPFGDPGFVEDIKSDIATRESAATAAGASSPDSMGPQGIENLALHLPSTMALPASFFVPGYKGALKGKKAPLKKGEKAPSHTLLGDLFEDAVKVSGSPYHPIRPSVKPYEFWRGE